jgi:CDP-paratose 2-epimerase
VANALAAESVEVIGAAFNLGGGSCNAVSLSDVLDEIARLSGRRMTMTRAEWRKGDQLYFVADTRRLAKAVGWRPTIPWRDGLRDLATWAATELNLPAPWESLQPRRLTA